MRFKNEGIPEDDEYLQIANLTTRFVCFLHPEIIGKIVEENESRRERWSHQIKAIGVDPSIYMWKNCANVFPGVRRHAGSEEIAIHRKQKELGKAHIGAVILDDNTFPKQIWSFIFRGRKFANFGPPNYSLAHLFDHKIYKNRAEHEFDNNVGATETLFGLYTNAAGTVYMPNGMMRPTDFSYSLRNLLQRKAQYLYGDFCNLLPPPKSIKSDVPAKWALENFRWRDPVGDTKHIDTFLKYRNEMMEKITMSHAGR